MLFQFKDAAIVKADALENSVSIQKAMIENRNLRLRFRKELAVNINGERLRGRLCHARLVRRFFRSRLPLPRIIFYQCCASTAICSFCKHKKISAVQQSLQAAFRSPPKMTRWSVRRPQRIESTETAPNAFRTTTKTIVTVEH